MRRSINFIYTPDTVVCYSCTSYINDYQPELIIATPYYSLERTLYFIFSACFLI